MKRITLAAVPLLAAFALSVGPPVSAAPLPVLSAWGNVSSDYRLHSVALDSSGNVLLGGTMHDTRFGTGTILQAITRGGVPISDLASHTEEESGSTGMVVDSADRVTLCSNGLDPFLRVDRGRVDSSFAALGISGTAGCERDAHDTVYVAWPAGHSVIGMSLDGSRSATNMGAEPVALTVASDGTRYTYNLDSTVSKAGPGASVGKIIASLPPAVNPYDGQINLDPAGNIYVTHATTGVVQKLKSLGTLVGQITLPATTTGLWDFPIVFDPAGTTYVGDNSVLYRLDWNASASATAIATAPHNIVDITVDASSQLYVATDDWSVAKFRP